MSKSVSMSIFLISSAEYPAGGSAAYSSLIIAAYSSSDMRFPLTSCQTTDFPVP